jgi:drug/metabolite transporter (DMT)-like permease
MVDVAATAPFEETTERFSLREWGLLAGIAGMWGSSFLLIEVALGTLDPPAITLLRVAFGALTLVWFRRARAPIGRADMRSIALLGVFWMAGPFLLFPIAQQWIDSSLAGMINGGVPVFAALFAAIAARKAPSVRRMVGIVVGFGGVIAIGWPAVQNARATALGAALVLLATISYGIALNIAVPLQHKYGSLPVLLRAQGVALALTIVPGTISLMQADPSWEAIAATVPLGVLGTGLAFVFMTTLAGRVGAARGSIAVYFIPAVAIALGAIFRNETIAAISLMGTALVLGGAYLTSRSS